VYPSLAFHVLSEGQNADCRKLARLFKEKWFSKNLCIGKAMGWRKIDICKKLRGRRYLVFSGPRKR